MAVCRFCGAHGETWSNACKGCHSTIAAIASAAPLSVGLLEVLQTLRNATSGLTQISATLIEASASWAIESMAGTILDGRAEDAIEHAKHMVRRIAAHASKPVRATLLERIDMVESAARQRLAQSQESET